MCGIAGVIRKKNNVEISTLKAMKKTLFHRGPDSDGVWAHNNVGLAHQRLSVIDLSENANQPMFSRDRRYVLIYNGEVYNFKQLRDQLQKKGFEFTTSGDTEVVLNALICWGRDAILKFHGPFAFAFCNIFNSELLIARDKIGEKPLYYYYNAHIFAFASELKALEQVPGFRKEINRRALVDYLTFGYISSPKTIWENVYKLEPAKYISIEFSTELKISINCYWKMEMKPDNSMKLQDAISEFKILIKEIAKEMLVSDVQLGVFLSGGVDSSGIVAALGNQGIKTNTFTVGFKEKAFNELPYARKVSDIYMTNHIEKILEPGDIGELFRELVKKFDEPFNDFSYLPTYCITREAKKHMSVCLSGDGSDELFCGYSKYPKIKFLMQYNKIVPYSIRKMFAELVSSVLPEYADYKRQIDRTGYHDEKFLFDMLAIVFKPRELAGLSGPSLNDILKTYNPQSVVRDRLSSVSSQNLLTQLRFLDIKMTLAEDMLVKVDRMSMLNSIEVRPVFLHPRVIDFALKLPENFLVNKRQGKYLLKCAFSDWLPRDVLYRKKMGFGVPLSDWFLSDLKGVMMEGLGYLPESWFSRAYIKKLVANHRKGHRDFMMQIHSLVFLGYWLKANNIELQ